MTDSKTKAKDAPKDATPSDDDQIATAAVVEQANAKRNRAAELATAREELLKKLAAVDQQAADEGLGVEAVPTHLLVLVDGSRVECSGAVPTHYAHSDGRVLPVTSVHSLEGLTADA